VPAMPDDIANLCALLWLRRGRPVSAAQLARDIRASLRLDAGISPGAIIDEALICELIELSDRGCLPTASGRAVGKAQKAICSSIQQGAKAALLERVYLNPASAVRCCGPFIARWKVDVDQRTFVYRREDEETPDVLFWLQTLQRVDLVEVSAEEARVRRASLGAVNNMLMFVRSAVPPADVVTDQVRTAIGRIGEQHALEYERNRLREQGFGWLIPAVQQVSLVDSSAGFDIVSCRGSPQSPDEPIFIEVKATTADWVQFFWSFNEQRVALIRGAAYWIYVYTHVDVAAGTARGPVRIQDPSREVAPPRFAVEQRDVFVREL
jgi:hypothetical protein